MWASAGVCPGSRTVPGRRFISEHRACSSDCPSPPPSPGCILLHYDVCQEPPHRPPFYRDTQMSSFPCHWSLLAPLNMQEQGPGAEGIHSLSTFPYAPRAQGVWSPILRARSGKIRSRSLHFPFHRCRVVNGEQCRINEPMSFLQRLC